VFGRRADTAKLLAQVDPCVALRLMRRLWFLAVEAHCERLSLMIVLKLDRDVDCISVMIINEP